MAEAERLAVSAVRPRSAPGGDAREIPFSPPSWLPRQWTLPEGQRVLPLPLRRQGLRGVVQPPGGAAARGRGTAGDGADPGGNRGAVGNARQTLRQLGPSEAASSS